MITAIKRVILRSIERAGYVVLRRDDPRVWQICFGGSQLHYDRHGQSASGPDVWAQLQVVTRELMSAREAAVRAERELEKSRAKLWQLRGVSLRAPCSSGESSDVSPNDAAATLSHRSR